MLLSALMLAGCTSTEETASTSTKESPMPDAPPPAPPVRREALDQSLRQSATRIIRETAKSDAPALRGNAVEAAQIAFGVDAHDIVANGLNDIDDRVRFSAEMAAGTLKLADLHDQLLKMADDPNVRIRIGARYALHRLGDKHLSHDFEKLASDLNPRVREDTALALGLMEEPSALKLLRPMIRDSDAAVRIQVAESMWRLGDTTALDPLVAGLISQFVDDQMTSLLGLTAPKDRRVSDYVQGKLTDPYVQVTLVAARCMGELGSDMGYAVATKSLRSPNPSERALAATALGYIGRSDAQSKLGPLLKDSSPYVRLVAATAIMQLKEPVGNAT
jgi:HEAT repeat protein